MLYTYVHILYVCMYVHPKYKSVGTTSDSDRWIMDDGACTGSVLITLLARIKSKGRLKEHAPPIRVHARSPAACRASCTLPVSALRQVASCPGVGRPPPVDHDFGTLPDLLQTRDMNDAVYPSFACQVVVSALAHRGVLCTADLYVRPDEATSTDPRTNAVTAGCQPTSLTVVASRISDSRPKYSGILPRIEDELRPFRLVRKCREHHHGDEVKAGLT